MQDGAPTPPAAQAPAAPEQQMPDNAAEGQPPATPPTATSPELAQYVEQREQRWATERQQLESQLAEARQYEQLVMKMAADPMAADMMLAHMDPNHQPRYQQPPQAPQQPQPNQPPQAPQPGQQIPQPGQGPQVTPDVQQLVRETVGNAMGALRNDLSSSLAPHLKTLHELQTATDVARLQQQYPDIADPNIQQSVRQAMAQTPGLSMENAYKLVTVDRAIQTARQQGINEGYNNARMGVIEPPTQAEGAPQQDQDFARAQDLMKAGNSQEAARIAMERALRIHGGVG